VNDIEPSLNGAGLRIGIAVSRFNPDITQGLRSACIETLHRLGVCDKDITLVSVAGALEISRALDWMAQTGRFDALIALGCVIRGETYHFEIVSNESARALMELQHRTALPIANAILTTEDDDQALVRMAQKGSEAAEVAIEMACLHKALS
jgi:6,7-dimethyl-8-ribityllumazine synthase